MNQQQLYDPNLYHFIISPFIEDLNLSYHIERFSNHHTNAHKELYSKTLEKIDDILKEELNEKPANVIVQYFQVLDYFRKVVNSWNKNDAKKFLNSLPCDYVHKTWYEIRAALKIPSLSLNYESSIFYLTTPLLQKSSNKWELIFVKSDNELNMFVKCKDKEDNILFINWVNGLSFRYYELPDDEDHTLIMFLNNIKRF